MVLIAIPAPIKRLGNDSTTAQPAISINIEAATVPSMPDDNCMPYIVQISDGASEELNMVVVRSPICDSQYVEHTIELRVGDALILEEGEKFHIRGDTRDKNKPRHVSILSTLHRFSWQNRIDGQIHNETS